MAAARIEWDVEARKARHRLYPVTAFYSLYFLAVLAFATGTRRYASVAVFVALGVAAWTAMEYLVHRYVLHGRFADGPGLVQHFLHKRFDHLHWEHHARPWDGNHINGTLKDTFPFAALLVTLAFLAPLHTWPVMVGALLCSYVAEEWVHHSVHYYHFKNRYFRYIKRHHLYHHSPKGGVVGYGLTNGFWDIVCATRIPTEERRRLYAGLAEAPSSEVPLSAPPSVPNPNRRLCS